jgi:sodium-dependent dicarboxylate transporter 2/3/5
LGLVSIAAFWTEISSNVATANVVLPIVAAIAISIEQNPLLLMIPVTLACSLAFMLPVATPPNAIVYASQKLSSFDMLKVGVLMNIFCIFAVVGWTFLVHGLFGIHFGVVPEWATLSLNVTRI